MAEKKSTTKIISDAKNNKTKAAGAKKNDGFPDAYMRFRTILDGFELTAMRYLLKDKTKQEE